MLGLLFVALAAPTVVLLVQTQRQITFESFFQYRTLPDELGLSIHAGLQPHNPTAGPPGYSRHRLRPLAGDPAPTAFPPPLTPPPLPGSGARPR